MGHVVDLTAVPIPRTEPRSDPLLQAVARIADVVAETAVHVGDRATWARWRPGHDGRVTARPGDAAVYDGDAGTAWACAHLAAVLERDDLADLARAATAQALDVVQGARASRTDMGGSPLAAGLLTGADGVVVAAEQVGRVLRDRALLQRVDETARAAAAAPSPGRTRPGVAQEPDRCPDLMSGTAGDLLAETVLDAALPGRGAGSRSRSLADLAASAQWHAGTVTWCDPTPPLTRAGGASCGIAHGTAGIALALAEWAAVGSGAAARTAIDLVDGALAWEGAWFDPRTAGWPDLRQGGEAGGGSSSWCLGGSGIGAVRLRLLSLVRAGRLSLRTPPESLRADVDASVRLAVRDLDAGYRTGWTRQGPDGVAVSLCHGVSGALDLLALAADELDVPEHRETARWYAEDLLRAAGDPRGWPSGVAGMPADAGLYTGLPGVALALLRVSGAADVPSLLLPLTEPLGAPLAGTPCAATGSAGLACDS